MKAVKRRRQPDPRNERRIPHGREVRVLDARDGAQRAAAHDLRQRQARSQRSRWRILVRGRRVLSE